MANVKKQFSRSYSLGNVFKRKRETPYKAWEEDALLETSSIRSEDSSTTDPGQRLRDHKTPAADEDEVDVGVWRDDVDGANSPSAISPGGVFLVDCFYLGACEMTGHAIRGRGCIDEPAGRIWINTQEKRRKMNSLPSSFRHGGGLTSAGGPVPAPGACDPGGPEAVTYKRKFVRLFAGADHLQIVDDITDQVMGEFAYRRISFVGTHPKYNQLFAFIAEEKGKRIPFLHAFKCEDKASASDTANKLSQVFERKIAELLAKSDREQEAGSPSQTIQVEADATMLN